MRLTIIMPFLNSHEIVRRQLLHFERIGLNDFRDVELLIMDDGSDPPLTAPGYTLERLRIVQTHDYRPWTSSIARNTASRIAEGEYLFMIDGDYIIPRKAIEFARTFDGDRCGVRRELGVLDQDGNFTQDLDVLAAWGVELDRLRDRGVKLTPHPNHFIIRKSVFLDLGGYDEKRILDNAYPQGEDSELKRRWWRYVQSGKAKNPDADIRPTVYMFPNGLYCGDVDSNPHGLFHQLSRKTARNHWYAEQLKKQQCEI